ncbi:MAG: ribonuclease Z [Paludibacteraceae bacterium]|nr:ribonuclease Z [Paludibacteraceae bacterium]
MNNSVVILGAGSAKPTRQLSPSGQVLQMCDKQFLIDCGEGTQISIAQMGLHIARLDNIFISHLHGDHCFGLIGLLSTLGMTGRTRSLTIHAHKDLQKLLTPLMEYHCQGMPYEIRFNNINPGKNEVIYEDRTLTVSTLPLKHKVPCCGFLFEEKQRLPHIRKDMIEAYSIPLNKIQEIKQGADFLTEDGRLIPNDRLTSPANRPFRYAYCADTAYYPRLAELIQGVDCLYHEATFTEQFASRCRDTMHSTARQAAQIAEKAHVGKLIIGHFSSRINDLDQLKEEASQVFADTILAQDRTVIPLN